MVSFLYSFFVIISAALLRGQRETLEQVMNFYYMQAYNSKSVTDALSGLGKCIDSVCSSDSHLLPPLIFFFLFLCYVRGMRHIWDIM